MIQKNTIIKALAATLFLPLVSAHAFQGSGVCLDIDTVEFIEEDQDIELGFDTGQYLPGNFDPYSEIISLKSINYMEESDEMDLDFETTGYLPKGFDAYVQ